eukprot:TRINITY_DN12655_c0_g1_i1.p1 TRINITY_DN12655_c0_g1~~TRINITY_DN12655_c0_g1_i1.p1  ORF type:complete len:516 (+),score=38.96 TRINITY_DN12655_c0_g1_i1:218-1765(+)
MAAGFSAGGGRRSSVGPLPVGGLALVSLLDGLREQHRLTSSSDHRQLWVSFVDVLRRLVPTDIRNRFFERDSDTFIQGTKSGFFHATAALAFIDLVTALLGILHDAVTRPGPVFANCIGGAVLGCGMYLCIKDVQTKSSSEDEEESYTDGVTPPQLDESAGRHVLRVLSSHTASWALLGSVGGFLSLRLVRILTGLPPVYPQATGSLRSFITTLVTRSVQLGVALGGVGVLALYLAEPSIAPTRTLTQRLGRGLSNVSGTVVDTVRYSIFSDRPPPTTEQQAQYEGVPVSEPDPLLYDMANQMNIQPLYSFYRRTCSATVAALRTFLRSPPVTHTLGVLRVNEWHPMYAGAVFGALQAPLLWNFSWLPLCGLRGVGGNTLSGTLSSLGFSGGSRAAARVGEVVSEISSAIRVPSLVSEQLGSARFFTQQLSVSKQVFTDLSLLLLVQLWFSRRLLRDSTSTPKPLTATRRNAAILAGVVTMFGARWSDETALRGGMTALARLCSTVALMALLARD